MENKVALITGASRGIGRTIAKSLANENYNLILCYNKNKDLAIELCDELTKKHNIKCVCFKCDISSELEIKETITKSLKVFSKIDVLVNNAGICIDCLFSEKTSDNFEKTLKTNLIGTFLISKYVGEIMCKNKYGKIINIASTNGINTYYPMCLDYDASKAGIISLTHNLAMQFAPYVNVNAVAPGFIATESEIKDMCEEFIKSEEDKIFLKRTGTEQDVANLVLFLASDKSNYINSEVIRIDGGIYGNY